MLSKKISNEATELYVSGLSVEAVADRLEVAYRTARKAILMSGTPLRDSSLRLVGRTRPNGEVKELDKEVGELTRSS